jgi:hypothetical protein
MEELIGQQQLAWRAATGSLQLSVVLEQMVEVWWFLQWCRRALMNWMHKVFEVQDPMEVRFLPRYVVMRGVGKQGIVCHIL